MMFDEYERLLNLSEIELWTEVHFEMTMPKWIADVYDYQMRYYQDYMYKTLMVPRTILFNLDGI